jgi:hypothetical protein
MLPRYATLVPADVAEDDEEIARKQLHQHALADYQKAAANEQNRRDSRHSASDWLYAPAAAVFLPLALVTAESIRCVQSFWISGRIG